MNEYRESRYPHYCTGELYLFSFTALKLAANQCHHYCVTNFERGPRSSKPCFYRFEDLFFGSCMLRSPNVVVEQIDEKTSVSSTYWVLLKNKVTWQNVLTVATDVNHQVEWPRIRHSKEVTRLRKTDHYFRVNQFTKTHELFKLIINQSSQSSTYV